jgi:hypothetical protein
VRPLRRCRASCGHARCSYTILDTSESAAFVHVNHGSPTQLFGNL